MENHERVLGRIYKRYNPEKLSTINALLEKYLDQEDELIEVIFSKYNISLIEREAFLENIKFTGDEVTVIERPGIEIIRNQSRENRDVTRPAVESAAPKIVDQPKENSTPRVSEDDLNEITARSKGHADKITVPEKPDNQPDNKPILPLSPPLKKRERTVIRVIISVLALIIVCGSVIFLLYRGTIRLPFLEEVNAVINSPATSDTANIVNESTVGDSALSEEVPLNVDTTETFNSDTVTESFESYTEAQEQNPINEAEQSLTLNFYIIAGSFTTEKLANEAVRGLNTKGFKDAQIVDQSKTGSFRVCYKGFLTKEECLQEMEVLKQKNPDAWIYKKSN